MDNKKFVIREYGRTELATLYSPNVSAASAWRKMKSWILKSPHLLDNLKAFGYEENQRVFTPMQVRLIITALGEP